MSPVGVSAWPPSGTASQFMKSSLYVGDLDLSVTSSQLCDLFNQVGQPVSAWVCLDNATGRSLGHGYVNFSNPADASRALEKLNYTPMNGKPIRIMYSHRDPNILKSGAGNIFIKNLEESIDSRSLHEIFSAFGHVLSCKVAVHPSGQSKGHGFVQFDKEESAWKAIEKMNGMLINDKQVFVGPFIPRERRGAAGLQAQFSQMQLGPVPSVVDPRIPMYPPRAPDLAEPWSYYHGPSCFNHKQHNFPGVRPARPGGAPMMNMPVPRNQQPCGRCGPPAPVMYQPVPTSLPRALADATPEQQLTMLGNHLYPLVENLEPNAAAKVTGMLLEMDQSAILHLLESPEALKAIVGEAMEVLRNTA